MKEYERYIINNENSRHWLSPREQKDLIRPCIAVRSVVYEVPNVAHSTELIVRQEQSCPIVVWFISVSSTAGTETVL
jgi:hypothetical protein